VDIRRGSASGDKVEVFGALSPGDEIVLRATRRDPPRRGFAGPAAR